MNQCSPKRPGIRWTKVLVYLSLLFVLVWLFRSGYLQVPVVRNPSAIAVSLILLANGFLASVLVWWLMLRIMGQPVSWNQAGASVGLTIFGKYIPGKLWVIVGRASYLSDRLHWPLRAFSTVSLNGQLLTIWSGLILGGATCLSGKVWGLLGWATFAFWLIISAILFSDAARISLQVVAKRFGKESITLPRLSFSRIWLVIPAFMVMWILWGAGFTYLVAGLTGGEPMFLNGTAFILAATTAIMSPLAPGGLGVREGLLVAILSALGAKIPEATTIAVTSRIWFLIGEAFIFVLGIYWHYAGRREGAFRSADGSDVTGEFKSDGRS